MFFRYTKIKINIISVTYAFMFFSHTTFKYIFILFKFILTQTFMFISYTFFNISVTHAIMFISYTFFNIDVTNTIMSISYTLSKFILITTYTIMFIFFSFASIKHISINNFTITNTFMFPGFTQCFINFTNTDMILRFAFFIF